MLINNLKVSVRNLSKRRGFTLLNVAGLAIGITCCLLIFHYVSYEKSYDTFQKDSDNIVRLRLDSYQQGQLAWKSATSYPAFGPTMKKDFPEVQDYCRLIDWEGILANGATNIKFKETKGYYADPSAIRMMGVQVKEGNPEEALKTPDKIAISESMAKKYFGNDDPLGKRLEVRSGNAPSGYGLQVSAVFKDFPQNSHLKIDYLVSYKTLQQELNLSGDTSNASETAWGWYDFYTYLQLKPGTDLQKFESMFPAFCDRYINNREWAKNNNVKCAISVIPLKDIHLYSNYNQEAEVNGSGEAVSFLFLVALFIIGIAWVNYINLSTARSVERAKEVGVRKVMGAKRGELIRQFLTESFILNITALMLSVLMFMLLIKPFDVLTDRSGAAFYTLDASYWIIFLSMFLAGTLLSGLYPAFVLSGYQPVTVLKGVFKNSAGGMILRKGLIITQFVISVVLIAGTIIVYKQVQFMREQKLGANISQTLVLQGAESMSDSLYSNVFQPFKTELMKIAGVKNVAASSSVMGKEIYWTNSIKRLDIPEAKANTMYNLGVDYDFIPAYNMQMLAGRNFSKDFATDNHAVMLTETGAKQLGFKNADEALNKKLFRNSDTVTVIGVVASYHHQGLQKPLDPMVIVLTPNIRQYYSVKLDGKNAQQMLAAVGKEWDRFFPSDPFNYFFLDDFFDQQYKADILFGEVFGLFAMLGIIIACFGLLGLSAYNVLQRTKEIGIRKVLGASEQSILVLLSKDFMKLVMIALVVAIPVGWFLMNKWLQDYAYRTDIAWWIFAVAGGLALLIALVTISVQAIKAALSNPVKSLRTE